MGDRVLVTGGAGFIGSHIVDLLVEEGYDVRVLDSFAQQVHNGEIPDYLNPRAEYVVGDVRDRETVVDVLEGVDMVSHQASAVGVAQSMYEIQHYADANVTGTATLLDVLVNEDHEIDKLAVASTMSNYGEGLYECDDCGEVRPTERPEEQMEQEDWEQRCPHCGDVVEPVPTPESAELRPTSIYAQTKRDQEEMSRLIGRTYGIDTVALRYFNVFGPRQSLDNPYTGIPAIFSSRIKNGNPPLIYEDGKQSRDFIYVGDVARANRLALEHPVSGDVLNIGTGNPQTVLDVAETLLEAYGADMSPQVTGQYRAGDIRHCLADPSRAQDLIGFRPKTSFQEGVQHLVDWGRGKEASDKFEDAAEELDQEGIVR